MRSSVSYILSHAPAEAVMSHPDYGQQAQHHACLLVLVKTIGTPPKHAAKLWERLQRVNNIKVTDSTEQVRDIWVRYVREYPVENNDWGDFQTHRRVLGLITISKFSNQLELNENCRIHESLKVKYSNTLIDSRAFMFGPVSNMKKPEQEPPSYEIYDDIRTSKDRSSFSDKTSNPSEQMDSLSSADSFPQSASSLPEENFTIPSNFKASQAMFYGESDPVPDLEQNVAELINMLFCIVESKRLERSKEKLEKVSLLLAPFEKRDFIGLDLESRTHKKRCMGRVTKNLADLTLQAGLVAESLSLYHSAADTLKAVTDWLWLAAAKEGLCAASAILLYPSLRSNTPLQRNASLQENSPNKTRLALFQPPTDPFRRYKPPSSPKSKNSSPDQPNPTELTPSSSDSIDTSSRQSDNDSESLASSSEMEYCHKSFLPDLPSIPRQPPSQINNQYLLTTEEMNEQYIKAITHYSQYQNAGIIETEACLKAARIAIEQNNSLKASSFLQNVIFINLTLNEQEKIQRFDTLAELYKEIGFLRKAAFCQRLAATRHVSPNNPAPDWQKCYYLMLNSFPGHKLSLDPNCVIQHQVGWPALQIQLLQELVVAARRLVHPGIATRHMTFLLQTMWPHLSRQEQREMALQLQGLSAACEGSPVPLVLSCGAVLPPASLSRVPRCRSLAPHAAPPPRRAALRTVPASKLSPFIFTPLHFAERTQARDEGDCDFLWVEDDICEVQLKLTNPLPFPLKVSNMRLLTSGVVFESIPETIIMPPETPTTVNLHGTPKESGELQILGYSTHTLGVKSNCRLKNMPTPNKFPAAYTIAVIPSLPLIAVETMVATSGNVNQPTTENVAGVTNISLYNGESTECTLRITNTSNVSVEFLDLAVQSNMDSQLQSKIFQWSNPDIQSQLPILPSQSASIVLQLYGEADFLDLGGVGGEHLFPNSLTSNCPSRVGSPAPPAQPDSTHEHGQSSLSSGLHNRQSTGSFRSTNSHATSWSAPLSVTPPSRGRQIETQVIIRYSGGKGVEDHCRQSTLQINLELLPSVSITHWDVLPAEVPTQLYLVLDVSNLTCSEMEFHYTRNKHLLIESRESCRVPVPLERAPFTTMPQRGDDVNSESKSTSTNASTSLEQMCSSHVAAQVDLRWQLTHSLASGRASVRGLTLSQAMCDIVRASPLDWEVAVDSQLVKPQSEYTFACGSCVSLAVSVSNRLPSALRQLRLSVRLYRDFGNGATCYKRGSAFVTAGNNKVMLDVLPESEKASHECTVVFLTPGEYKVDIQCSTTEPILEDAMTKDGDANSMIPSCGGEINHVWRFIPPVAISVTD